VRLRHLTAWPQAESERTALRVAWQRLLQRCTPVSIFQTFEWHEAWWTTFGHGCELHLLLVEDDVGLRAIAPFVIETRPGLWRAQRCLTLLGTRNHASDYADVIVPRGDTQAAQAVLDWVIANPVDWHSLQLENIPGDSPTLARYAEHAALPQTLLQFAAAAPARRLGDAAENRALLQKKSLRRHVNGFRRDGGVALRRLREPAEIDAHLEGLFEQHCRRWANTPTPSLFNDPQQREFYRAVAARLDPESELNFSVVLWRDAPIAYHFGFERDGVFTWYKPSFEPSLAKRSPGEVLLALLFEDAIERGLREFDFTVGDESFKYRFANIERQVYRLRVYRHLSARLPALARHTLKRWIRRSPHGAPSAAGTHPDH